MSTAHRPNFSAAKARAPAPGAQRSQQTSVGSIPQHTKLKFRQPAASGTSSTASGSGSGIPSSSGEEEVRRRDLKRELERAEWEAKNRKRVKAGLEPLPLPAGVGEGQEEEEGRRRRREAIARAIELDRESDDDDDEEEEKPPTTKPEAHTDDEDDSDSSASDTDESDADSDSEDEQTLLLRELEKIKAERAAEKQRLAALASTTAALTEQEEIARGNPLLNLQAAFSSSSTPSAASATERHDNEREFGVKKRWDHDVIFKNQAQAAGNSGRDGKPGFVNDLTRSEFHRKFINRYIK